MFGAWRREDWLIIGMELADRTLMDRYQEVTNGGLKGISYPELMRYSRETAKVIDYLNKPRHFLGGKKPVGIQHGDIKPQNILLVGGGVKVGDFGLVRLLESAVVQGAAGMTIAYASPECFAGQTSRWSDQYSLAVTYCHLRGGALPFAHSTDKPRHTDLEAAPDLTMLPAAERPAVERALARDPRKRWPNCRTFVQALVERPSVGEEQFERGARGSALGPRAARARRKVTVAALVAAVLLAAGLTAGLLPIMRRERLATHPSPTRDGYAGEPSPLPPGPPIPSSQPDVPTADGPATHPSPPRAEDAFPTILQWASAAILLVGAIVLFWRLRRRRRVLPTLMAGSDILGAEERAIEAEAGELPATMLPAPRTLDRQAEVSIPQANCRTKWSPAWRSVRTANGWSHRAATGR